MFPTYVFEEMRLPMELFSAALLFLLPFAEKKPGFLFRAVAGFVAAVLFSLLYFLIFLDKETPRWHFLTLFWYSGIGLLAAGYARLCFRINGCDAVFFDIAAFLTQNIVYCVYHCFFARVLFPVLRTQLPLYILGAVIACAIVYIPVYQWFRKTLCAVDGDLFENTPDVRRGLTGLYLLTLICLFFYQNAFELRESYFETAAWFSGMIISVLVLILQYSVIRGITNIRKEMLLENMLKSSERYYEMSKEHIAIINRKCHDLKHQLKALERSKETDRDEYIREVKESVDFYKLLVYTDNEALNTILAEKGLFCREKDIDFQCAVDDVDLSFIRLPDLYAILGNAIDNAIEYVETQTKPDDRVINLRIEKKNHFAGIQVVNPYAGGILSPTEFPPTHKSNPEDHGFGMRSIRFLVEKYHGAMEYSTADGLFTLQILIPLQYSRGSDPQNLSIVFKGNSV